MTLSPRGATQLVLADRRAEPRVDLLVLGQSALGLRRCLPGAALCGAAGLHQPGRQCHHRRGRGQARRGGPAGRAAAGHDGIGGHRGGTPAANALLVPIAAVREADAATPWVMRLEGRHGVRRDAAAGPAQRGPGRGARAAWLKTMSWSWRPDAICRPGCALRRRSAGGRRRVRADGSPQPCEMFTTWRAVRVDRRDALPARGTAADRVHRRRRGDRRRGHRVHVGADGGFAVELHPPGAVGIRRTSSCCRPRR
jgi:hypothetical protein